MLCYVLTELLKLLHPFMPFITEEIYQALPHADDFIMTSRWPEYREELHFAEEETAMEAVMDTIKAVRARRAEMNVPPSKKAEMLIVTATPDIYARGLHFIQRLAYEMCIRDSNKCLTFSRQKTSEKTMEIWLVLWYDKKSDSKKRRDSHAAAPGG